MTMVIALGTRLDVRMRARLENGVLHNGQQPGSAENSFFDYSKFEAIKSLSGWDAAHCDEHQFRAKIQGEYLSCFWVVVWPVVRTEKWHFC